MEWPEMYLSQKTSQKTSQLAALGIYTFGGGLNTWTATLAYLASWQFPRTGHRIVNRASGCKFGLRTNFTSLFCP